MGFGDFYNHRLVVVVVVVVMEGRLHEKSETPTVQQVYCAPHLWAAGGEKTGCIEKSHTHTHKKTHIYIFLLFLNEG